MLDSDLHYFNIFHGENEHLFFCEFTEGNIVKKNVTIRSTAKRFIYSMSALE